MSVVVVLDACVLYPASLRDALLRLAEIELFDVKWSDRILEEAIDNLVADGRMSQGQAAHLMRCMVEAFDDACVPRNVIEALEPVMNNDPKDRHVLAAAVACGAQRIITLNLKDFPSGTTDPHGLEAEHPDDFLLAMLDLAPDVVQGALRQQAADCANPPKSVAEVVQALEASVPRYAARVRDLLAV